MLAPGSIDRASARPARSPKSELPVLRGVRRVLFLGDSITYGGLYVDYLSAYLATRFPESRCELLNLGLPSETASGLSEPGHAGGAFPRPDIHERLARALAQTRPELVLACYGMNDGIYSPISEDRLRRYQEGIGRLVRQVKASGARVVVLTPPVFDPVPLKGHTLPAGREAYPDPYEGYDQVLACYSAWLVGQRRAGWHVVDIHGPMSRHLAARRAETPGYLLAGDGVHANPFGHWLFAQEILADWGAPSEVDRAGIDLRAGRVLAGSVSELHVEGGEVHLVWETRRPMPMDARWDARSLALEKVAERFNRHRLVVSGAPAASYRLYEGETLLGTASREELAAGLDLLRFPELSTNRGGEELLRLIRRRQALLTDSWLTAVGHHRPGMGAGLPLPEAQAKAAELDAEIRKLAAPVRLSLRLAPVPQAESTAVPKQR